MKGGLKMGSIIYDEYGLLRTVWMFVIAILIVSLLTVGIITLEHKSCAEVGKSMGMPSKYSIWTDCMLKVDGNWIKEENYGEIIIRKERG